MDKFLEASFPFSKNLKKETLTGDGGHRHYTRIKDNHQAFILMSCGKHDPSLKKFVEIQKRLDPLVYVPKLFQKDYEKGLLLLEDLGDQNLNQFFKTTGEEACFPFYQQALLQLLEFQNKVNIQKTDPVFDNKFFIEENKMAIYHLQTYINQLQPKSFDKKSSLEFKKDMKKILTQFKIQDYVYCHRDYHSRNLMLKKNKVAVIDFQDAGAGPWPYDLTSLLYDCYVPLNPLYKKKLLSFYIENLPSDLKKKWASVSPIDIMVKLQFLQRGFKACGRFAAFKNENQKNTHLKYILPTLELLKNQALDLSYKGIYTYIHQMTDILRCFVAKKT